MKKRVFGAAALFAAVLGTSVYGGEFREFDAEIYVDGISVTAPAYIDESNSSYVPLRCVFEAMGCEVEYIPESKTAKITYSDTTLSFSQYDTENTATINGSIYLPLRAVSEQLGFIVNWNEEEKTINISGALKYADYTVSEACEVPMVGDDSDFAARLCSLMNRGENFCLSPLSLKYALAMTANGADDETKDEILKVLSISDLDSFNSEAKAYIEGSALKYESSAALDEKTDELTEVISPVGTGLSVANSIWLNEDYIKGGDFSDEFKALAEDSYGAEVGTVTAEDGADKINRWCSEATGGKISRIAENTDFVSSLVNAVYFNGKWAIPFSKESTEKDLFKNSDGTETETDFMNNVAYFPYYADENVKILSMGYNLSRIRMYIALSEDENTDVLKYTEKAESGEVKKVKVKIPKFTVETSADAKELLKSMGIEKAFDESPSAYHFKYMFNDTVNNAESIYVSNVLHKTYISIDEEGTEAAAISYVTNVGAMDELEPEEIYEFTADRPFTYFIKDNSNGEILFMGRFANAK